MKPVWKWILGILAALLAAAVLFGLGFLGQGAVMWRAMDGLRPMMDGRNFTPFAAPLVGLMGLRMLFALLIPLGILFGVIYGAVRLAIRDSRPRGTCPHCGKPL